MPLHNIDQIISAAAGTKPWFSYWSSLCQIVKNLIDDVANLIVGALSGIIFSDHWEICLFLDLTLITPLWVSL